MSKPDPRAMKRVNQFLRLDQIARLAKLGRRTNEPAAEHTRRAVDRYLAENRVPRATPAELDAAAGR